MNYGAVRDATLKLLNQYSIAGTEIANTYNNQQDYLSRIPSLVNDAQVYIATTAKRIPATIEIELTEDDIQNGMYAIQLPSDLYRMKPAGLIHVENGMSERLAAFRRAGNTLYLPANMTGLFILEYYRYPEQLPDEPLDTDDLDNTVDVQTIIPYYVAAHLVLFDDSVARDVLQDEFEARLSRLSEDSYVEVEGVRDEMGFEGVNNIGCC